MYEYFVFLLYDNFSFYVCGKPRRCGIVGVMYDVTQCLLINIPYFYVLTYKIIYGKPNFQLSLLEAH